jgi:hypothetical protein
MINKDSISFTAIMFPGQMSTPIHSSDLTDAYIENGVLHLSVEHPNVDVAQLSYKLTYDSNGNPVLSLYGPSSWNQNVAGGNFVTTNVVQNLSGIGADQGRVILQLRDQNLHVVDELVKQYSPNNLSGPVQGTQAPHPNPGPIKPVGRRSGARRVHYH